MKLSIMHFLSEHARHRLWNPLAPQASPTIYLAATIEAGDHDSPASTLYPTPTLHLTP